MFKIVTDTDKQRDSWWTDIWMEISISSWKRPSAIAHIKFSLKEPTQKGLQWHIQNGWTMKESKPWNSLWQRSVPMAVVWIGSLSPHVTSHRLGKLKPHFPHRISAGGSLLFMRDVSLTLTGLISAWRRGEASSAILAKPLSDCVTVLCLGQRKSRQVKVCGILKRTCYFLNILHS